MMNNINNVSSEIVFLPTQRSGKRESFYTFSDKVFNAFLQLPHSILTLIREKDLYSGSTYFPEKKHASIISNIYRQFRQIFKHGAPEHYYFLYGLDTKSIKDSDEYVNYMEFHERRDFLNYKTHPSSNSCAIMRNKLYWGIFAQSFGFYTPQNVAYIHSGKLLKLQPSMHEVDFSELFTFDIKDLFCKSLKGENGNGIFTLTIVNNQLLVNDQEVSIQELQDLVRDGDYIIQERIKQHPDLDKLYPNAINTFRLITVRSLKDGKIHCLPSIIRVGAHGSYIDNGSQGGIMIIVDLETGRLSPIGWMKPEFGSSATEHPDTHIKFDGFVIPMIKESVEQAIRFHDILSDIHSIGWDIAITEKGPCFIEANDNWEIEVPQLFKGCREEFEEYFY